MLPGAAERVRVVAADGSTVEAVVDRHDPGYAELELDPRAESYLAIRLLWSDDRGYHARLYTEPQGSHQYAFNATSRDVREVVDAAVDWLATGELRGHDGPWAARTLREVARQLPLT